MADIPWRDKVHGNKNSKMRTIGQKFMSLLRQVATGFDFCSGKIPLWESGVRKIISCERKINYTFSKYCFIFVNKLSHTATVNKIKTLKAGHRESNRYFFLSVFLCSTVQLMFVRTAILNVLSSWMENFTRSCQGDCQCIYFMSNVFPNAWGLSLGWQSVVCFYLLLLFILIFYFILILY